MTKNFQWAKTIVRQTN